VVKPIWGVVPNVGAKSTLCLPLWSSRQKDPHGTGDGRVEFGQFPGGVLVQYPPGAKDSFLGCTVEGRLKRYPRPITASRFPHHRLTVQEAAFASKAAEVPLGGRGLREGDYLILLGVHIITREVPDWLWTTFWWTPEPKHEPFASDQIAAISRDPVWRHFALDVAADTDLPQAAGRKDGKAHKVAFNPYLEAPQRQGTYTNCLSCHARSLWVAPGDRRDLMRGAEPFGPDELPGALRTRFLWSIVLRNAWQAP
jgi:hypothetical protein